MRKLTTGERIKDRRKLLGISAADVAEILEINVASYYKYENNSTRKIPAETLIKIAHILNCTPEFLAGHELDDDKELKTLFMQLSSEDREKIIRQMRNMVKKYSVPFFKAARKKKDEEKKHNVEKIREIEDIDITASEGVTDINDL